MAETYTEMMRRALGNTAGPAGFLLNENAPFVEFLRRRLTPTTRPATPPAAQPAAPTTPTAPTTPQEPARRPPVQATPTEETPETFEAMRQFQAGLREQQMQGAGGGGQLSVLDMLRKRMANTMEDEQSRRMADLGTALLTSRNPSFFGALGEGFRAQDEGSRARMEELRRLADLERQDAAQRAEEARRTEELRIREAAQAAEAPLRAAQTRYYLSRAETDPSGAAFTRAENAARGAASAAAERAVQAEINRRSRAVPPLPPLTAAEITALRNTTFQQGLIERGFTPPAGAAAPATTAAPATPAVRIDASGREIR